MLNHSRWLISTLVILSVLLLAAGQVHAAVNDFATIKKQAEQYNSGQQQLDFLLSKQAIIAQLPVLEQVRYWHMVGMMQDRTQQVDAAYNSFSEAIKLFEQHQLPLTVELPNAYIERSYMQYLKTFDPKDCCDDRRHALPLIRQLPKQRDMLAKILVQNAFCFSESKDSAEFKQGLTNETMDHAIARADHALYQAKETGRNRVVRG